MPYNNEDLIYDQCLAEIKTIMNIKKDKIITIFGDFNADSGRLARVDYTMVGDLNDWRQIIIGERRYIQDKILN